MCHTSAELHKCLQRLLCKCQSLVVSQNRLELCLLRGKQKDGGCREKRSQLKAYRQTYTHINTFLSLALDKSGELSKGGTGY